MPRKTFDKGRLSDKGIGGAVRDVLRAISAREGHLIVAFVSTVGGAPPPAADGGRFEDPLQSLKDEAVRLENADNNRREQELAEAADDDGQ